MSSDAQGRGPGGRPETGQVAQGPVGPAQEGPGPEDWIPVVLGFARDRSADGWAFTTIADVREAMTERHLLGAVQAEGPSPAPDRITARIAVHPNGRVATLPDKRGPVVDGPPVEEIISGLAHSMKTVISLDDQLAIGTAGVPLESIPEHMTVMAPDRRHVYLWPGTDRFVAETATAGLQEAVTWHDTEGWTVLASPHGAKRVLQGLTAAAERFPFVKLTRVGPERRVEYVQGKGEQDLRLMAWWGPWLEPLANPKGLQPDVRGLQEMLAHPRLGDDEMSEHERLREGQRQAINRALADHNGATFLHRVSAALEIPEIGARLAEQRVGDTRPDLAGEPMEAKSRLSIARGAMQELNAEGRPTTTLERKIIRGLTIGEVVLGLVFLATVLFDFLPGPWWLWLALGLLLTGDGIRTMITDARDARKAKAGDQAADS